ncbi:tetratricopeptide repeat protein [Henriciella aquimarina]|uniref:tetratricopeptide repeat protein n=1 Tax=Henriciella aquimarina TaxID=545261 RepID=UPI000A0285C7|nr:hypothetical protein [Henriciella aquimarina]
MTRKTLYLLAGAVIVAAGLYLLKGRPLLAEQPYATREAELANRNAEDLSPPEMLARLQMAARQQPDAPEPQYFIGVLLRTQGRTDDALRAFQSSLRRDDEYVPALIALADAIMMRDGGVVTEPAARLYDRAWRLDPTKVRAGMLAAMPAYEAGDVEAAEQHWAKITGELEPGDPRLGMLEAFKSQADERRAEAAAEQE